MECSHAYFQQLNKGLQGMDGAVVEALLNTFEMTIDSMEAEDFIIL